MRGIGQQTLERQEPADGDPQDSDERHVTDRRAPVSRRSLLTGIASSVALAACADVGPLDASLLDPASGDGATPAASEDPTASETPAAPPSAGAPAPGTPVDPVLADDQVLHVLRRATFGPTNEMVASVQERGVEAWLDEQLAPDTIDDGACEQRLDRFPMLDRTARQINDTDRDQGGQQRADERLVEATVVRALCTERQLYEVMVEFWANHFSIHTPSGDQWGRRTVADREVYRPNALGRFADLLVASAKDPRCCTTSTTRIRATGATSQRCRRTMGGSCSSCTRWAWTAATPRRTSRTRRSSSRAGRSTATRPSATTPAATTSGPCRCSISPTRTTRPTWAGRRRGLPRPSCPPPRHRDVPRDEARAAVRRRRPARAARQHARRNVPRQRHRDRSRPACVVRQRRVRRVDRSEDPAAARGHRGVGTGARPRAARAT